MEGLKKWYIKRSSTDIFSYSYIKFHTQGIYEVNVKVKFILKQATKAQMWSRAMSSLMLETCRGF